MQRFLVIRLSSIGDIVHALPAVAAMGETFPQAEIYWAVETRFAGLLEGNPYITRLVKLDTLGWRKKLSAEALEEMIRSIYELREVPFDAAIDFQGLYKSALIAWLSRSRARVGFAEGWLREPAVSTFYTECVRPRGRRHIIEMNMALVEHLGARPGRWQFPLPRRAEDDRMIEERLAALEAREFIVIVPGGGWKSKRWAPENYADLIRRLETELPWTILLTGSREEEELIQSILDRAGSRRARYFPSTIVQLIALARRAKLFVGGDTGPVHLAAAVGTPLVAIYGSTDPLNTPERNGPFSKADIVLAGRAAADHGDWNRNASYIMGVSIDSVLASIRELRTRANG